MAFEGKFLDSATVLTGFFHEIKSEMSTKSTIFECLVFRIFFRSDFFSRKNGVKI